MTPKKRKNNDFADGEPEWFKKFKDECFRRIDETTKHNEMVIEELRQKEEKDKDMKIS